MTENCLHRAQGLGPLPPWLVLDAQLLSSSPAWAGSHLVPLEERPESLDRRRTETGGQYQERLSGQFLSIIHSCSVGKLIEVPIPAAVWSYFTDIFKFPKVSSALCRNCRESSVLTLACPEDCLLEDTWGKPCSLIGCSVQSVDLGHK